MRLAWAVTAALLAGCSTSSPPVEAEQPVEAPVVFQIANRDTFANTFRIYATLDGSTDFTWQRSLQPGATAWVTWEPRPGLLDVDVGHGPQLGPAWASTGLAWDSAQCEGFTGALVVYASDAELLSNGMESSSEVCVDTR